jgi:Protein of unknown function C-terminus (DUF2451)
MASQNLPSKPSANYESPGRNHWWNTLKASASSFHGTTFHPNQENSNPMPEFPLCRSIDEALHAFRWEPENGCLDLPRIGLNIENNEYDWILDGRWDDEYHARQSDYWMEEMRGPDWDVIFKEQENNLYFSASLWNMQLQTVNFAAFPESNFNDDDDEFGDFQGAEVSELNVQQHCESKKVIELKNQLVVGEEKKDGEDQVAIHKEGICELSEMNAENFHFAQCDEDNDSDDSSLSVPNEVKLAATNSEYMHDNLSYSSQEDDESIPVEWDLTTPEGRFLRRQQSESLKPKITLPQHLYESQDDTILSEAIIRSLPWENVAFMKKDLGIHSTNENDMEVLDDHLMTQLMQLDGWLDSTTAESLQRISQRKIALEICNQHVRELKHSLTLAEMYVLESKKSIQAARGDELTGLSSELVLLEAWNKREVNENLDALLNKCSELFQQESNVKEGIHSFLHDTQQLEDIMASAKLLSIIANEDPQLSRITSLEDIRNRSKYVFDTFMEEIKCLIRKQVTELCVSGKGFHGDIYSDLLKAMLRIHPQKETSNRACDIWATIVVDTLFFEADKACARALLQPTHATSSSHSDHLSSLASDLRENVGDDANLKTILHNLVTIRFGFEADSNYFPMVYHQLCAFLTDILFSHRLLLNWHKSRFHEEEEVNSRIFEELSKKKTKLWIHCERVLCSILDEYITFASKKKLFDSSTDQTLWLVDLDALHDVMQLTHQFCIIGREFVGEESHDIVTSIFGEASQDKPLLAKLSSLFQINLRALHVENMNYLGSMLSKETWDLVPLLSNSNINSVVSPSKIEINAIISRQIVDVVKLPTIEPRKKLSENRLLKSCPNIFSIMASEGNPFTLLHQEGLRIPPFSSLHQCDASFFEDLNHIDKKDESSGHIYDLMATMVNNNLDRESRLVVQASLCGFIKCIARLLLFMEKLPLSLSPVAKVIENISDLYITTVFRLCTGNGLNESLVLGIQDPKLYVMETPKKAAHAFIGFGRKMPDNPILPLQPITSRSEGEVCSPLPCERDELESLKIFIKRSQVSLEGIVKLDMIQNWIVDPVSRAQSESEDEYLTKVCNCLEKRTAAAWSCLYVAAVLDFVKDFATLKFTKGYLSQLLVSDSDTADTNTLLDGIDLLTAYAETVKVVVPKLINFSTKMSCARAIGTRRILEEISRIDWNMNRLNESSHYYVDLICGRYCFIWGHLIVSEKLPRGVLNHIWLNLVAVGYLTFLEGFARVPLCSTEGRSAMSLDIAAFAAGVSPTAIMDNINLDSVLKPPPTATIVRGRQYVESYIKVSYFPLDDMMDWISQNFTNYQINHCLSLARGKKDFLKQVEKLYNDYYKSMARNDKSSLLTPEDQREIVSI